MCLSLVASRVSQANSSRMATEYSLANVKSNYFGYKSFGSNAVNAKGTRGGNATYNIQKPSPGTPARPQPDLFVENWDKITGFCQDSHRIAVQLLRYISRACGMDEEVVAREHAYGEPSGDHLRMMFYSANRNGEIEAEKEDPRRIAAHTGGFCAQFIASKAIFV